MPRRPLRTTIIALLAAVSPVLAACGNKHDVVTEAHSEGVYVDLGPLDYQVQISRVLNPAVPPDRSYVSGIPEFVSPPEQQQTWFGVFLRVQNQTDEAHDATNDVHIVDTTGKEYAPITLDADENPFAYQGGTVQAGEVMPGPDTSAGFSSAQGQLLLFKVTYDTLGNRPVKLVLEGDDGGEAEIELDL